MTDVVVVGSGASGVNVAAALVNAGRNVTLLDFGNQDRIYGPLIPPRPFSEVRRTDEQQHRYFLGDNFEGIPFGSVRIGAQLTPPRLYISADAIRLMPVESATFSVTESLALGGLASGWGAGVFPYNDEELKELPISRADMEPHYEVVAERIGIAGDRDDLLPYFGDCAAMMPPLEIDSNAEIVMARYARRRREFNALGFYMGRPRHAVCTRPHRGRGPHEYHDMDFWADTDRSVYRPLWTLEELQRFSNFTYLGRRFVLSFAEREGNGVEVIARHADSGEMETHRARAVVLAAGTLSTSRIVLRSLGRYGIRIPIVCNPHTYVPVVNFGMLGQELRDRRHSLAQLTAIYRLRDFGRGVVQAEFYSYRSLLAFRLLKELPLPHREGLRVVRLLSPLLGILVVQHEDHPTPSKYCILHRSEGMGPDRLEIHYQPSKEEVGLQSAHEKVLLRFFRRLGCWPIKPIRPGHGSSIHYAGTFPMNISKHELTYDADCRLAGTNRVYLADGSVFPYLPAKGLTFTMMANANRVGTRLARMLG